MELRRYIRDRQGNRIGVLVSNTRNSVGWSLCARSHGDRFDLERGLMIARAREANGFDTDKIPMSIRASFADMLDRSQHYFKA